MITIEQCRGARGILGWTQQELANASGLSKTAINNFEKGHSDIKAESLRAIRVAFESAEIEFLGQQGISKRSENIKILKGQNALNDLLDDIHQTLITHPTDLLINQVDSDLPTRISTQKLFRHIDFIKTHNIKERIVCTENTQQIFCHTDDCRWLTTKTPGKGLTSFIYGGKVALELWNRSMIVVINSPTAYEAETERFEHLWAEAITPSVSSKNDDKKQAHQ